MIEIVLRRPCRVIGMRMVEPEQIAASHARLLLRLAIVIGPHEETTPWSFLRGVRQRVCHRHAAVAADERAATFIRVGGGAMLSDGFGHTLLQRQRHQRSPSPVSSQKRSDRYFSPPSQ